MRRGFRVPPAAVAAALLALITLLATLQYQWLGRISAAERESMRVSLTHRAREFAQDFDREVTRAYLLFHADPLHAPQDPAALLAERVERWHATSAFPRIVKEFYVATRDGDALDLQRFEAQTRRLERTAWPESMRDWRTQFADRVEAGPRSSVTIRRMAGPIWESVPAIVVPAPMLLVTRLGGVEDLRFTSKPSYTILALDLDYIQREMLPALARRHFRRTDAARAPGQPAGTARLQDRMSFDADVAIVSASRPSTVHFRSTPAFTPKPDAPADASADLFQVRTQDFNTIAADIRRFTAISTIHVTGDAQRRVPNRAAAGAPAASTLLPPPDGAAERITSTVTTRAPSGAAPRWRLLLKHPSGSLDTAVNAARRRNLAVSTSILAVLAASMGLLVLSTRRAQQLARQQMEFVAAVSHELRTPLAVIRSAGENLADGVVREDPQIRRYGELVRSEGRRLSEMVEQILAFAGIHAGQRGMTRQPVAIAALLEDVLSASAALIEAAGLRVDRDLPEGLPPVLGDAPALRRAFENLVSNAIKYGEGGKSIAVQARGSGPLVVVRVVDHGIGIPAAEQPRIFDPFYRTAGVVAAQIHGAGLGLSLVKRIVEAHGGTIAVTSAPGTGSEFTVTLPAAWANPRLRTARAARMPAESAGHG